MIQLPPTAHGETQAQYLARMEPEYQRYREACRAVTPLGPTEEGVRRHLWTQYLSEGISTLTLLDDVRADFYRYTERFLLDFVAFANTNRAVYNLFERAFKRAAGGARFAKNPVDGIAYELRNSVAFYQGDSPALRGLADVVLAYLDANPIYVRVIAAAELHVVKLQVRVTDYILFKAQLEHETR